MLMNPKLLKIQEFRQKIHRKSKENTGKYRDSSNMGRLGNLVYTQLHEYKLDSTFGTKPYTDFLSAS